jgi:8-oxo-dGTP pyrophosphatase MutT (NUDIX family)
MTHTVKTLYSGRIVDLGLERVALPDGRETELEIVRHPGGAAVVALDHRDRVCLVHQYRHAAGGWLWELPAGKLDCAEDPGQTARRELEEEAGVRARAWRPLGILHSSPGVCTEVIHLFLARDLQPVGQQLEHDELLEVHWMPFDEALQWAVSGRISDAKTLIGLFRAAALSRGNFPSEAVSPAEGEGI